MRTTKTEIKINNYKLIKLKSRHYEIIVKRPRKVIKGAVRLFFIGGEGDRWAAIEVD